MRVRPVCHFAPSAPSPPLLLRPVTLADRDDLIEANRANHDVHLGFRREGFSTEYLFIDGAWRDCERWALLDRELDLTPDPPA